MADIVQKYIEYKNKNDLIINGISSYLIGNQKGGSKYAIITLLMMGDNYLPGCLVLAKSILQYNKPSNIDLVCMVTNDVSNEAIHDLEQYYDRVVKVSYIEINPEYVKLKKVKNIYSKTFTKIQCLNFVEYSKVLLIDSDMIIMSEKIFDVFNYNAPAGVFLNCIRAYEGNNEDVYKKIYKKFLRGYDKLIPKKVYNMNCSNVLSKYGIAYDHKSIGNVIGNIFIETSICLLSPSAEDFDNIANLLNKYKGNNRVILNGDSNLLNIYYKYKWHFMDYHYLGRWIDPEKNNKYFVLDLYGFDGKPWQIEHYQNIKSYADVKYWVKNFIIFYESEFSKVCGHESLHKIYNFFMEHK